MSMYIPPECYDYLHVCQSDILADVYYQPIFAFFLFGLAIGWMLWGMKK